jgi:hypothetical protein
MFFIKIKNESKSGNYGQASCLVVPFKEFAHHMLFYYLVGEVLKDLKIEEL